MSLSRQGTTPAVPELWGRLTSLPISLLGLALFRAWVPALMGQSTTGGLLDLLHDGTLAVFLLVAALLAPRIAPLFRHRWPIITCGATAIGAWAAFLAQHLWGSSPALQAILTVLCAASSTLFILQWCEVYAHLPVDKTTLVLGLSFVLGRAFGFVFEGMAFTQLVVCLLSLPLLCLLALIRARGVTGLVAPKASATPIPRPARRPSLSDLPWGVMVLIGLYYMVSGMCLPGAGRLSAAISGSMTVLAGCVLVGAVLLFGDRLDLSRICTSPVAVLCCVLLLIPFGGAAANPLTAACTSLSSSIFELVVFLMMCDLCRHRDLPAVFVFGIEESLAMFKPLGAYGIAAMGQAGLPTSLTVAVAVGLLAVATLVLFNRTALQERWDMDVLTEGGLSEGRDARERLAETCEKLARQAALTPREQEALAHLAAGLTVTEVAEAMGVARGTAKAHCEHIYAKLGIHGRDELTGLLEGMPAAKGNLG